MVLGLQYGFGQHMADVPSENMTTYLIVCFPVLCYEQWIHVLNPEFLPPSAIVDLLFNHRQSRRPSILLAAVSPPTFQMGNIRHWRPSPLFLHR